MLQVGNTDLRFAPAQLTTFNFQPATSMRRFSQRTHLVTLNEINITPLLDLAFVLLIIFVITTPLLENGMNLKVPKSDARPDRHRPVRRPLGRRLRGPRSGRPGVPVAQPTW